MAFPGFKANHSENMSSEQADSSAAGNEVIATERVKPNRYEVYDNSKTGKLVNSSLETSPSQALATSAVGKGLFRENPREKGIKLHIKELAVPVRDNGNLNSLLTMERPKSAVCAEQGNLCSLFGVSLNEPLKYSRNVVNIKDDMDKRNVNRRRSSCSDLKKSSRASDN